MKKYLFPVSFLLTALCLHAADTVFLGPRNLRVIEEGEFSAVNAVPSPEAFDDLWAYKLYPAEKKLTGKGVTVAVADSGISSHSEFNGKHIQGQDFTLSGSVAEIKNGLKDASIKLPGVPDVKQGNGFIDVKKIEKMFTAK